MNAKPAFFEPIRQKAVQRWDQLEQDPELAGPWHQLFKQVQSPRHILSELLQNADDAGATEASVRIEKQVFIFEHNGEDFSEKHFESLCRFGYSNKRSLHTIGFRGIGFKSTFSLGGCVELFTPTLAVSFDRKRFTEPHWLSDVSETDGKTQIRVGISDDYRLKEVEKNLDEWLNSPISLLFFKHIRRLQIGDHVLHWSSAGPGPIPDSEWMALSENIGELYLLIRSAEEVFPNEALTEIKQERMIGVEEDADFPPCKVEIVLGARGRLYVVLPTGVETQLPFACNAPFIQDPARMKIKDPETSPTNRWLLGRAGQLAALAMCSWVGKSDMPVTERAASYGLLPDVDRDDNSLEGVCGAAVEEAFAEAIKGRPILLKDDGELTLENESVIIPPEILDIWSADIAATLLDDKGRPALSQYVEEAHCKKLLRWGWVDEIDKQKFLNTLQEKHLPKPKTWGHLLNLWVYIAPEITGYHYYGSSEDFHIVPVQGKEVLYSAAEVVRLGEKKLLHSDDDWKFLASHLIVLNQNWSRFLAEQRRAATDQKDASIQEIIDAAYAVLEEIGLDETSNVDKMIEQVALYFFAQESISLKECVQLTQIAAKLGAAVEDSFRFVTRDKKIRSSETDIYFDVNGKLEELLPEKQHDSSLLHPDYVSQFISCSEEEWLQWISSGRSNLQTFVPLIECKSFAGLRGSLETELRKRDFGGTFTSKYRDPWFSIKDWDFEPSVWKHWQNLSSENPSIWMSIAERIVSEKESYWSSKFSAHILEEASNGYQRIVMRSGLMPKWVMRLRDLPCLPDTRGFCRKPSDLLRRTPETECLMDIEPFVHGSFDREKIRPLLDLLGVRSIPTGPDRILDCLRALARTETPPVHEVEKWYRRLDQMIDNCSTSDFQKIKQAFRSETLVLTQDGTWAAALAVFLCSDEEDVLGVAVIRSSVSDLTFWRKIGLAERPTLELAIQWLRELPSGQVLSQEEVRRVRALLVRYPVQIWMECAHWLNLAGEWAPTQKISFALTMQSLIPWLHLHQWVKQKTADLQRLPGEVTSNSPFSELPKLSEHVEDRFYRNPQFTGRPEKKVWLTTFGIELRRVELDTEEDTRRIRAIAETLARTNWHATPGLEIIPYIDGTPAGMPRRVDVLWLGESLFVDHLPKAKLARRVPEEISKAFARQDNIKAALDYSFERSPEDVREYLEENFKLAPKASIPEMVCAGGVVEPVAEQDKPELEPDLEVDDQALGLNGVRGETDGSVTIEAEDTETASNVLIDAGHGTTDDFNKFSGHLPSTSKPHKPSIIERFAKSQGFRKDNDERFFHEDGSWISRAEGARFPWERRTATGDLIRYYWPKDHCLEREPLQVDADIWWLIDQQPETYAFILSNVEGRAVEVTGSHLRKMRDGGEVTLYPATYSLMYHHDKQL